MITLRELRARANWTQEELMRAIGAHSHTSVSLWERGKRMPRLDNAKKIAQVFGVPLGELVFGPEADSKWTIPTPDEEGE